MSDKKSTYRVLIATIIGGKHLTVGAVVELSDEDASAIGAKFVQLAKVEAPAPTLPDAEVLADTDGTDAETKAEADTDGTDAETKAEADTPAADKTTAAKTTATKPATKAK